LDAILVGGDTVAGYDALAVGDRAITVVEGTPATYVHVLRDTGSSESSPTVIAPDNQSAGNAYSGNWRWELALFHNDALSDAIDPDRLSGDGGDNDKVDADIINTGDTAGDADTLTVDDLISGTPSSGDYVSWDGTNWVPDTPSGSGDVTGPGSSTDNAIVRFNGTGGKTLQNTSGVTIDDSNNISTSGEIQSTASGDSYLALNNNASIAASGHRFYFEGNVAKVSENGTEQQISTIAGTLTETNKTMTTGDNTFKISTASYAAAQTLTSAQCYGTVVFVTGAAVITLPAVAAGMNVIVYSTGANAVSVDANAADRIILDGTALNDGDKVTSASAAGDYICLIYESADGWVNLGRSGTWTDGGA
jgi:hypothetical protein